MIRYKLYIDFIGLADESGYFEIEPVSVGDFSYKQIDGIKNPELRPEWGDVVVENKPYEYRLTSLDKYKLSDIIQAQIETKEIHLKFVSDAETIYGYFGKIDCIIDDDADRITIKPTTLDQYTYFLENYEEDVSTFKKSNIIANSEFKSASYSYESGWSFPSWTKSSDYIKWEQKYGENVFWAAISDNTDLRVEYEVPYTGLVYEPYPTGEFSWSQSHDNVIKGSKMSVSFFWKLIGTQSRLLHMGFDVLLYDPASPTNTYRLKKDGSWTELLPDTTITEPIYYSDKVGQVQIPDESAVAKYFKPIITDNLPIGGTVKIKFYRYFSDDGGTYGWYDNTKLYITKVDIECSSVELRTIKFKFSSEDVVTCHQEDSRIYWQGKPDGNVVKFFKTAVKGANKYTLDSFIGTDGKPNFNGALSEAIWYNGITYSDLEKIFAQPNSPSYKFELSKLTVYKGIYRSGNWRSWFGIAEYSREETTKKDVWIDNVLQPPAENSEWVYLGEANEAVIENRKWVRYPFNGTGVWERSDIDAGTGTARTHEYGFEYHDSLTTTKIYPTVVNTTTEEITEVNTSLTLREFITKVFNGTHEQYKGKLVKSTFLFNDVRSDAIMKALGMSNNHAKNYFSGASSNDILNNISVIHTTDLRSSVSVSETEEKTTLKINCKKLLEELNNLFKNCLMWWIDEDYNLNIEHQLYFDRVNTAKNISGAEFDYLGEYNNWEYDKSELFAYTEYTCTNAGYEDFALTTIEFDKLPSNKRNNQSKQTYSNTIITSDFQYCKENTDSLDNGIILVTYDSNDNIKYGFGKKSGKSVINGDLSPASLAYNYGRYNGTWKEGLINDYPAKFLRVRRAIKGKDLTIKGIFTPNIILSKMGVGVITNKTIDYVRETTTISPMYGDDTIIAISDNVAIDLGGEPVATGYAPTVETLYDRSFDGELLIVNGNVLSDGGELITERGICYGGDPSNITVDGFKKIVEGTIGYFSTDIDYEGYDNIYYKAYAINSKGTSYGALMNYKF